MAVITKLLIIWYIWNIYTVICAVNGRNTTITTTVDPHLEPVKKLSSTTVKPHTFEGVSLNHTVKVNHKTNETNIKKTIKPPVTVTKKVKTGRRDILGNYLRSGNIGPMIGNRVLYNSGGEIKIMDMNHEQNGREERIFIPSKMDFDNDISYKWSTDKPTTKIYRRAFRRIDEMGYPRVHHKSIRRFQ